MKSAKALIPSFNRDVRLRDELAFLPAALEIVETPASPVGRLIPLTIMALFTCALIWATLGKVDIVSTSSGRIVPSGRTKVIQPFEIGIVRAIHVRDGDVVKTGDVLIELDPTVSNAELGHIESDLAGARLDVARLKASVADGDPMAAFVPPEGAPEGQVANARQLLASEIDDERAKLALLDRQAAQKAAERDSYTATVNKLKATIPILQQRVDIQKYLADKGYGSKITYLEALGDLVQQQKDLPVEESHLREAEAALQSITDSRAGTIAEYRSKQMGDLADAEQKAAGLEQDAVKAQQRTKLQVLTAPVDGVVQQLAVHTVGGVVTPAQPLLQVVPRNSKLEIEATISNRDVGFVHVGQDAEIKVDTFNFTKYGLVHGTVLDVSADAIAPDKPADDQALKAEATGGQAAASQAEDQELGYLAHIGLDQATMDIDGKEVGLSPGLAVTVEIKTGSRSVLSYLLSPLLRFKQEALRER